MKNIFNFLTSILLFAVLTFAADGQTKHNPVNTAKPFFVPCGKALQIGFDAVETLHSKEMQQRAKGETDSDMEFSATDAAAKNYLDSRRADNAAKLKKLPIEKQRQISLQSANAKKIARMRVNLIYGVLFDEKNDEPINYAITQKAIALVEDFKSNLIYAYRQTRDSNALGNTNDAERDEKQIAALLGRIEKAARETDQAVEYASFKTAVKQTLANEKDTIGTEKAVTTAFLVRLLKMNLADEN